MLTTNCVNYTKNTASASAMKRILAESFALKEANEAHIMAARKLLAYCKDVQHMTTKLRRPPHFNIISYADCAYETEPISNDLLLLSCLDVYRHHGKRSHIHDVEACCSFSNLG